jgi:hypothetical protein
MKLRLPERTDDFTKNLPDQRFSACPFSPIGAKKVLSLATFVYENTAAAPKLFAINLSSRVCPAVDIWSETFASAPSATKNSGLKKDCSEKNFYSYNKIKKK